MTAKKVPNVHLETMEEAENKGCQPAKAGVPKDLAYHWGNSRLGYWRIAGSPVLTCSITNEKLALAGYYDFPAQYEQLRDLR